LLCIPELDAMVNPGEKRYAVCIANSQKQAGIFRDHALSIVSASPALRGELANCFARCARTPRGDE